jgi:hypothetical protein
VGKIRFSTGDELLFESCLIFVGGYRTTTPNDGCYTTINANDGCTGCFVGMGPLRLDALDEMITSGNNLSLSHFAMENDHR